MWCAVEAAGGCAVGGAARRVVDRLLASPHYGERMAMLWLDLVRFADTDGYHSDVRTASGNSLLASSSPRFARVQDERITAWPSTSRGASSL